MDKLSLGLSTTVIGMLVVFFGLVILIACIYVMTTFTGRKSKKAAAPETKAVPVPEAAPVMEEAAEEAEDEGPVIAAITAAIAVLWNQEEHTGGFVVRRVRRTQGGTARARAARDEQMYSRL
jgi:sodium pump decarboxylase gamma subunit